MNIGSNIKTPRTKNNISQEKLADYLGVSFQAVSKWENNFNLPDITFLPEIAKFFHVSIDGLFSDNVLEFQDMFEDIKDDNVIRIVQLQGKKIIKAEALESQGNSTFEVAFPRNCNDSSQYFKVEVFGNILCDSSINGDVVCHGRIDSHVINGDIHSEGDIHAYEIHSHGSIVCNGLIKNKSGCNCHQNDPCAGSPGDEDIVSK